MRYRSLAFILGLAVNSLWAPFLAAESAGLPPRAEVLAGDLGQARDLLDRSLAWRGRAQSYLGEAGKKVSGGTLSSADLQSLYAGAEDYVFLSRRPLCATDHFLRRRGSA